MNRTFGKVVIGCAVVAAGSAGAIVAFATTGTATKSAPAVTAAVTSVAPATAADSSAIAPAALAPAAVTAPAAAQAPAVAFDPAAGRAFPRAATATSTANCPNMGSGAKPHPTASPTGS
jgi:hypothetical protein